MKFAYTIWNYEKDFKNVDQIVAETKDVVDIYIITTWPWLAVDNDTVFLTDGMDNDLLLYATGVCLENKKEVAIQILPTPKTSRGKIPEWWQGWINYSHDNDWRIFFDNFYDVTKRTIKKFEDNDRPVSSYLVGAEMVPSLDQQSLWSEFLKDVKCKTSVPIGYSHHFSRPLRWYYRWHLTFALFFGYIFHGNKIYGEILEELLAGSPFVVPKKQLTEVGKSLLSEPFNYADFNFVKLNDYYWHVIDKEYPYEELLRRWENAEGIKFLPAVRDWKSKFVTKPKPLWIENDCHVGAFGQGLPPSDKYYTLWWNAFLQKHADIADVIVVWDAFRKWNVWAEVIRKWEK